MSILFCVNKDIISKRPKIFIEKLQTFVKYSMSYCSISRYKCFLSVFTIHTTEPYNTIFLDFTYLYTPPPLPGIDASAIQKHTSTSEASKCKGEFAGQIRRSDL